jgi:hypothetical protein
MEGNVEAITASDGCPINAAIIGIIAVDIDRLRGIHARQRCTRYIEQTTYLSEVSIYRFRLSYIIEILRSVEQSKLKFIFGEGAARNENGADPRKIPRLEIVEFFCETLVNDRRERERMGTESKRRS